MINHPGMDYLTEQGFEHKGRCGSCGVQIEKYIKFPFEVRIKPKSLQYEIRKHNQTVSRGHIDNMIVSLRNNDYEEAA